MGELESGMLLLLLINICPSLQLSLFKREYPQGEGVDKGTLGGGPFSVPLYWRGLGGGYLLHQNFFTVYDVDAGSCDNLNAAACEVVNCFHLVLNNNILNTCCTSPVEAVVCCRVL